MTQHHKSLGPFGERGSRLQNLIEKFGNRLLVPTQYSALMTKQAKEFQCNLKLK